MLLDLEGKMWHFNILLGFRLLMSCVPTHNSLTSQIASHDLYLALCEATLQIVYLYRDVRYSLNSKVVSRTDVWQQFWNIYIFLSWKSALRIHMKYISNKLIYYTMCVPLVSALQFTGPKSSCRHEWVPTQGKHYNAA